VVELVAENIATPSRTGSVARARPAGSERPDRAACMREFGFLAGGSKKMDQGGWIRRRWVRRRWVRKRF
jgi:hypothetical protein